MWILVGLGAVAVGLGVYAVTGSFSAGLVVFILFPAAIVLTNRALGGK